MNLKKFHYFSEEKVVKIFRKVSFRIKGDSIVSVLPLVQDPGGDL